MPTSNHKWIKWIVILVIVLILYGVYTCKSKAEEDPHDYYPVFNTPDPSTGIYDVIESDNPEGGDDDPFFPNFTFQPLPGLTDPPDDINGAPQTSTLKYDPFLVYSVQNYIRYKRLNGTVAVMTPPISTSYLHTVNPTVTSGSAGDGSYEYWYKFNNMSVSGITQANTLHNPNEASLLYLLTSDFTTVQPKKISKGDTIQFSFSPHIKYQCTEQDLMFNPSAILYVNLTFKKIENNSLVGSEAVEKEYVLRNDGKDLFTFTYEYDHSGFVYLSGFEIQLVINPVNSAMVDYEGSIRAGMAQYYFTQDSDPIFDYNVFHHPDLGERIGSFFNNLINHIDEFFVPNQTMIESWISDHSSDDLDSDNPLNLVKDLYVSLMDKFSGNQVAHRPVIHVPPLSFDIHGYGKVTPFEGYTWNVGSEGVVDGSGNNLWYYVKLATSILIATGLIGKMWSWFKKWYDTHYAGDGGSE